MVDDQASYDLQRNLADTAWRGRWFTQIALTDIRGEVVQLLSIAYAVVA